MHDRLGSDTYKRMALALGATVLLVATTHLRFISVLGNWILGCARLAGEPEARGCTCS